MAQRKSIRLGIMRLRVRSWPHSVGQRSGVAGRCGVGGRYGSDPALLWLWCRPAAVAPTGSLAWEPPYAADVALKSKKKKNTFWKVVPFYKFVVGRNRKYEQTNHKY